MEQNLTVLTFRITFILYIRHVTSVVIVKSHFSGTWKFKMSNKCVSLRNSTVSCVYCSMEPNLTVLTLRNDFILLLRHLTAVIIGKTRWPVI